MTLPRRRRSIGGVSVSAYKSPQSKFPLSIIHQPFTNLYSSHSHVLRREEGVGITSSDPAFAVRRNIQSEPTGSWIAVEANWLLLKRLICDSPES